MTTAGILRTDAIVVGRTFDLVVRLDPAADRVGGDVTTELTGATVAATIVDPLGVTVLAVTGALVSAAERTIRLSLTAAQTSALVPGMYRWDVRVTTSSAKVWAIDMNARAQIRLLA